MKWLHFIFNVPYNEAMEKNADTTPAAKSAGRPRASELAERHRNLIRTAGELFLKHGYGKVSLELIAREAHVAVRTIYVKFGGKAGLFREVLEANREKFFALIDLETDPRHYREVILDFGMQFLEMVAAPDAVAMQRMVISEASTNPELSQSFFDSGPRQTRDMLKRFFTRPDISAELRDGIDIDMLAVHLSNCVIGDQFARFLFGAGNQSRAEIVRDLERRLDLFYHAVLKHP